MKRRSDEPTPPPAKADTTPLRVPASTGIGHCLRQPGEYRLEIRPVRFFPILGGAVGLVLALVGVGVVSGSGHPGGWFVGGIGAVAAVACSLIVLLGRRFEFDRRAAVWWVRRLGSGHHYPLDEIRAVQLIHGGWYGGGDRPRFNTYQLNLVLGDPDRPRVNVTNTANWEATWGMASALSDFLGVPLQDEVSEE
jgi:hypothetical protein